MSEKPPLEIVQFKDGPLEGRTQLMKHVPELIKVRLFFYESDDELEQTLPPVREHVGCVLYEFCGIAPGAPQVWLYRFAGWEE